MIETTLHSREAHEFACIVVAFPRFFNEIEVAWAIWVLSKQSFASKLDGSWGYDKQKSNTTKKVTNAKALITEEYCQRLEHTQIESTDALRIISSRDTSEAFHFVDPPYIGTDCGHYADTFNLMDFQNLLELLTNIKGKFMLTMFPHPLLEEFVNKHNWRVVKIERQISASKTKRRKQEEWIVMNY